MTKIGILDRSEKRSTGIETFEQHVVPALLEDDRFCSVTFTIREGFPLSGTVSRAWTGRKLRQRDDLDALFVPSHDLMNFIDPDEMPFTVVPYVHDLLTVTTAFTSPVQKLLDKRGASNIASCSHVACNSRTVRRDLIERTGFSGTAEAVYQGIGIPPAEKPVSYDDRHYDLIYVGTMIPRKDPATVRTVAERIADDPDRSMVAVNYEPLDLPCETKTDITDDELTELYDNTRYYLHPSYQEGFGRGPVEAQRRGCVPIARANDINDEILGTYIKAAGADDALDAAKGEDWEQHSKQCIEHSRQYDWETTVSELREYLVEVAG